MSKGEDTRGAILETALSSASTLGLSGLSIGELARELQMSKSGLFAHFDSKEHLQLEVLRTAVGQFIDTVISPALRQQRGEPRVRALFENWFAWATRKSLPGGCLFISSASEFDDQPGAIRDYLVATQRDWLSVVRHAVSIAVEERHFRSDLDPDQFAHDFYSILLAYHHFSRLLESPDAQERALRSFEQLIGSARG